ncbi:cytochrome P450 9e2-like [Diabrotica undecimpunctata]|uniref:cytochrome P450 9e2-like n=1 Tax=Diabrotica undecimpunctata TaxID=50387 RepID=UPI003B63509F
MLLMLVLLVAGLAVALCFFVRKRWHYWKDLNVDQADIKYIFKNIYILFSKRTSFAEMSLIGYNKFPKSRYVGTYQLLKPMMLIKDPELLKDITVKNFDHFMDHTNQVSENSDPLWTKNLVALRGQQWRDMRAVLSPSFTSSKMKVMFTLMTECAQNFSKHFQNKNEDVVELELKETFTRFTNDVIATTAFGIKVNSLDDPDNEFYLMGREVSNFTGTLKMLKFMIAAAFPRLADLLKLTFFDKETRNFFTKLIDKTVQVREDKGIVRPDMIHLLMQARKGVHIKEELNVDEGFATAKEVENIAEKAVSKEITNLDITAQAVIFFLAGFETVASTMCFVGYELAANPEYQKRLREEIIETLDQCQENLTYEALLKMKYMDMVVSESLRKWPAAIMTERQCTKDYIIKPERPEEAPVTIKKGMSIWMPVYPIHRDPKYYPDPDKFDPERFNEQNKSKINPYTYLPFGLGPRNCIGSRFALLEIKAVFFYLLKDFQIVPVEKSQIPLVISKKNFNLTSEGGFWFGLKRL